MEYTFIPFEDYIYKVYKEETESKQQFNDRCWFIAKHNPNPNTIDKTVALSKIFRNVKYLDTKYSKSIMKMLE